MKKSGFKWMSAVILSGALASYTACTVNNEDDGPQKQTASNTDHQNTDKESTDTDNTDKDNTDTDTDQDNTDTDTDADTDTDTDTDSDTDEDNTDVEDLCTGVTCGDNSTCRGGICQCEEGYKYIDETNKNAGCEEDLNDPCRDIDCSAKANSSCVDGYCECDNGYSESADHNFCVPKQNYPEECKTMVCGPHSKCGDFNNPRCICEGEYSTYNGGTDCINEALVKCQVIEGYNYTIPHGEYDKDAMVSVYFDGKKWNDGPEYRECPVKCTEEGYEPDADKANCVKIGGVDNYIDCAADLIPAHAVVTSNAKKESVWNGTAWVAQACDWRCDGDYVPSDDGKSCREKATGECGANDIFISEVIDGKCGTSSYRAIEIYNACANSQSLDSWSLQKQANGASSWTNVKKFDKTLVIEGGKTLIIGQSCSSENITANITAQPDTNGDDVIGFFNKDGALIDIYGQKGVDGTGKYWEYSGKKVIRNPGYKASADFATADTFTNEWDVKAADFSTLGNHQFTK